MPTPGLLLLQIGNDHQENVAATTAGYLLVSLRSLKPRSLFEIALRPSAGQAQQ